MTTVMIGRRIAKSEMNMTGFKVTRRLLGFSEPKNWPYNHTMNPRLALVAVCLTTACGQQTAEPTASGIIIADGNSLTAADREPSWFSVVSSEMQQRGIRWINVAESGRSTAQLIASAPALVDAQLMPSDRIRLAIMWEGSNDLYGQADVSIVIGHIRRYAEDRRRAGWRVVVVSILPRTQDGHVASPAEFESERQQVNATLRLSWRDFADAFVDVGGDPVIGSTGADGDPRYYETDRTHLTAQGQLRVAALMQPVIAAELSRVR